MDPDPREPARDERSEPDRSGPGAPVDAPGDQAAPDPVDDRPGRRRPTFRDLFSIEDDPAAPPPEAPAS